MLGYKRYSYYGWIGSVSQEAAYTQNVQTEHNLAERGGGGAMLVLRVVASSGGSGGSRGSHPSSPSARLSGGDSPTSRGGRDALIGTD